MITLKNLFKSNKEEKETRNYSGLSDFLTHASESKKREMLYEAARRADNDQRSTFERAKIKIKAS